MGKAKRKKRKIKKVVPYDMEQNNSIGGGKQITQTRGHILQRHKVEYRMMKQKMEELKAKRFKLNSREKKGKKEISKQIKTMKAELELKHKKELEEFDQKEKERKEMEKGQKKEPTLMQTLSNIQVPPINADVFMGNLK